jgi:hypothetical protein
MASATSRRRDTRKPEGIAPTLLVEQVTKTAPWAFAIERLPSLPILKRAPEIEKAWRAGSAGEDYFATLLAAHYTTVATFCPTDVDVRIRQHVWRDLQGARLAAAVARVEEVTHWPVPPVSARHVVVDDDVLAGHQGEWFSVMAGALGRALAISDKAIVERTTAWIESELGREAKIVTRARKRGTIQDLLCVVTTVAHNLGDLSRVVDTWSAAHASSDLGRRYQRLGHEDASRFDGAFVFAGELNKQLMALENHRFLPLREPKALRREREFLLPFGPYLFEWGKLIGSTKLLDDAERADILLALVRVHEFRNDERGCLRAIAGIHSVTEGGVERLAKLWPADLRSRLLRGGVQEALRTSEKDFLKAFHANVKR